MSACSRAGALLPKPVGSVVEVGECRNIWMGRKAGDHGKESDSE